MPDLFSVLSTVAVGAGATLITLKVTMARVETQLTESNRRMAESDARMAAFDQRVAEIMASFRTEAGNLRQAVTDLTRTVDRQSGLVDGMEDVYERLRVLEVEVAVIKSRT